MTVTASARASTTTPCISSASDSSRVRPALSSASASRPPSTSANSRSVSEWRRPEGPVTHVSAPNARPRARSGTIDGRPRPQRQQGLLVARLAGRRGDVVGEVGREQAPAGGHRPLRAARFGGGDRAAAADRRERLRRHARRAAHAQPALLATEHRVDHRDVAHARHHQVQHRVDQLLGPAGRVDRVGEAHQQAEARERDLRPGAHQRDRDRDRSPEQHEQQRDRHVAELGRRGDRGLAEHDRERDQHDHRGVAPPPDQGDHQRRQHQQRRDEHRPAGDGVERADGELGREPRREHDREGRSCEHGAHAPVPPPRPGRLRPR